MKTALCVAILFVAAASSNSASAQNASRNIILGDLQTKLTQCRAHFATSNQFADCAKICFESSRQMQTAQGTAMVEPWNACVAAYVTAVRASLAGTEAGTPLPATAAASPQAAATSPAPTTPPGALQTNGTSVSPQSAIAELRRMRDECAAMAVYENGLERQMCVSRCTDHLDRLEFSVKVGSSTMPSNIIQRRLDICRSEYDKAVSRNRETEPERNAYEQQADAKISAIPDVAPPEHLQTKARNLQVRCESGSPRFADFDCDCILREYPPSWDRLRRSRLETFYREQLPAHQERVKDLIARNTPQSYIDREIEQAAETERRLLAGEGLTPPVPEICRQ